ncbi:hypothetical protein GCM10009716_19890 [Streptomyces sodiiphilus]|uniref:Transposase IS200-like domain-containing protein n=1 Tax=Streptomyces sodiiphilus TaxID=226217 RepID=A0ABN2P5R1_9ACTN
MLGCGRRYLEFHGSSLRPSRVCGWPPGPPRRPLCEDFEAEPVEFNGENTHVHLLVHFPPKVAVSKLVNSLKGVSSRRLRQEFPDLAPHYWRAQRLWSGSYFAGTALAAHRSAPSNSTSNSRTDRLDLD